MEYKFGAKTFSSKCGLGAVQVRRLYGDLQGNKFMFDEEEMLDAQEPLESGFQLLHKRTIVGDLVSFPDALEVLDLIFQGL